MDWIEVGAQVRIFVTFSGPRKGEGGLRGEIEGGMGDQSPSAPVIIGGALHHYQVPPLTPIYSGANVRHRAFLGVRRPSLRENMQSADACFLPAGQTHFSLISSQ